MAIEYIWSDRKRYFGLPMSFTRYALSEDRLFLTQGLLSIRDDELLLYRVRDITTSRSLWQRIFGVGTVTVISSDKSSPRLEMKNIKSPLEVKEKLHAQVEKMKRLRRSQMGTVMMDRHDDEDSDEIQ